MKSLHEIVCEAVFLRIRSNIHRKLRGSYENIDIEITEARGRGGKFRLARSNNDKGKKRAGRSIVSQREKRWPGRVVYFKFFQTLRRTRRETKKASVAKKRGDVGGWLSERQSAEVVVQRKRKRGKRKERSATGRESGGIVLEIE